MSDPLGGRPFPRGPLVAVAALIGFALLAAILGRLTQMGASPAAPPPLLESRQLCFEDRADGTMAIYDVSQNRQVEVLAPGSNGFLKGVLRGFARERKLQKVTADGPLRLARQADGLLTLDDPSTGRQVFLGAFGPTNEAVFARLLTPHGR